MDLKQAIRDSYLAQGLTEEQLEKFYAIADVRSFADGELLLEQDNDEHDLIVVIQGRAVILSITEEPIGYVRQGMPIGEISFLDGKPRSVSVRSVGDSQAVFLDYDAFWRLLRENQDIAFHTLLNMSRVLCARLRSANRNLAALMALDEVEGMLPER